MVSIDSTISQFCNNVIQNRESLTFIDVGSNFINSFWQPLLVYVLLVFVLIPLFVGFGFKLNRNTRLIQSGMFWGWWVTMLLTNLIGFGLFIFLIS